jgi:hypothetical protein
VPQGTALTSLDPEITIDGTSVSPLSGTAQDFFTADGYSPVVYTVTAVDGSNAYWTVTVKWEPLEADADIGTYLANPPSDANGGVSGGPVILPVSVDLSGNGWADLLDAIDDASSVSAVALDLSACTGGAAEFDPDNTTSTGKDKIVSLILPDTATSIKARTSSSNNAFKHFTALKSVVGGAITNVGEGAFQNCTALKTVNFPAAITIGGMAFYDCKALKMVSLPVAITISPGVFVYCTVMERVNLPSAATIDRLVFQGCTGLTEVNLPAVQTIGDDAFFACTSLTTISLPASLTNIDGNPFVVCTNLTTITVDANNPSYKAEGGKLLSKDGKTLIGWPAATGSVDLSGITTVGDSAFQNCTGLTSISLPAATSIGEWAFGNTETEKVLTITLGVTPPELGTEMFYAVYDGTKSVTVKVPDNAAWSGKTGSFTGNNAADTWGNGFRGGGWNGTNMTDGSKINENINLTIEIQTAP